MKVMFILIKRINNILYLMSIIIVGSKDVFLSKNSINRLKKTLGELRDNNSLLEVDVTKYIKPGYSFNIIKNNNDINVNIVDNIVEQQQLVKDIQQSLKEKEQYEIEFKRKQELRAKLRNMTSSSIKDRTGEVHKKLASLKRSIPNKIYDSYTDLITHYKMPNIPAPDEVINNVDKYKLQIGAIMGKVGKLSDDVRASNAIRRYFTTLGEFLGVEPMSLSLNCEQTQEDNTDTDEED